MQYEDKKLEIQKGRISGNFQMPLHGFSVNVWSALEV